MTVPVSVVVSTKNEEYAIERCLTALNDFDQVIVVDSQSTDRTKHIAASLGAEVVDFAWDGRYPKKKQWCLENVLFKHPWVLFIDADEVATPSFVAAVAKAVEHAGPDTAAFDIPLSYRFQGRTLRFGHVVQKRALIRPDRVKFPVFPDLQAPGMGELEGHYQPTANGEIRRLPHRLTHDDPDPLSTWVHRHNKYSDWEAYLRSQDQLQAQIRMRRSKQGRAFDHLPFKPLVFFLYSYVIRLGILDGRAGFDYAFALSFYYWLINAKVREVRAEEA